MNNKLTPVIKSINPISQKSIEKINEIVEFVNLQKGESITSVGKNNNKEYFIIDGVCRSFLHSPKGEDVTISFFMPSSVISPSITRNKNGKSIINLQAITSVEMATMDAAEFENLMIEDLEIRNFGNSVLRNELIAKVQKEIALASLKGQERLIQLRKTYPNIENIVSHSAIASYLGITTISLSRLRTKS